MGRRGSSAGERVSRGEMGLQGPRQTHTHHDRPRMVSAACWGRAHVDLCPGSPLLPWEWPPPPPTATRPRSLAECMPRLRGPRCEPRGPHPGRGRERWGQEVTAIPEAAEQRAPGSGAQGQGELFWGHGRSKMQLQVKNVEESSPPVSASELGGRVRHPPAPAPLYF